MPSSESHNGWYALLVSIRSFIKGRMLASFSLIAVASLLEGAGLILLLPVAELILSGAGEQGMAARMLAGFFAALGIETVMAKLTLLCAGFLILMLVRLIVLMRRDMMLSELSQGYVDNLRKRLFGAAARADWSVIKRMQRAHLLDNMTTNIARVSAATRFLSQAAVTFMLVLAYMLSAFFIDRVIGTILLIIVAAAALFAWGWSKRSHRLGHDMTRSNRAIMDETTRFLDGLKAAKACQAVDLFCDRFAHSIDGARAVQVRFASQQGRMRRSVEMLGAVAAVTLLLVGYGVLGLGGAQLLILGAVIVRLMPGLMSLLQGMQTIAFALPAFTAAEELCGELEAAEQPADNIDGVQVTLAPAALLLENVTLVSNEENGSKTLLDVDRLALPPTGLVHIGGASGAGKSTLAEMIAGLHLPSSGRIMCADMTLSAQSRAQWQSRIAFAPQEPFLFAGTVRDNLNWPDGNADDEQLWAVLKIAAAHELVETLPGGLAHPLQDGGSRLSGGERQRLCLARALLRPAAILILDEATSAVDAALEVEIMESLSVLAQERLILFISHSPHGRNAADIRLEINDGRLLG